MLLSFRDRYDAGGGVAIVGLRMGLTCKQTHLTFGVASERLSCTTQGSRVGNPARQHLFLRCDMDPELFNDLIESIKEAGKIRSGKRCTKCGKRKWLSDFSKHKRSKDGLTTWCKKCVAEYHKKYYQNHKNEYLKRAKEHRQIHRTEDTKYQKEYRQTINGYLHKRFQAINHRCNNPKAGDYERYGGRGIKNLFESFGDFFHHITIDLGLNTYKKIRGLQIDRINNEGYYEKDNIRFVTRSENMRNTRRQKCQS